MSIIQWAMAVFMSMTCHCFIARETFFKYLNLKQVIVSKYSYLYKYSHKYSSLYFYLTFPKFRVTVIFFAEEVHEN